ncbi:filamin-C [Aplysia californica]|uniref:Filamin-C n=1 Tax=Aplysia californica TaxID=6500 RepID=A0ABM0ZV81_APLCA|nr:filamin-C [Aplysia californica]
MKLARQHFNIPLVLRPEDLASSQLDEKSAITYLSYFIRVGGPGYDATLQRVTSRTQPKSVTNFTTDWQDGRALHCLVLSAGGKLTQHLDNESENNAEKLIETALKAGKQLGVDPLLNAKEITEETTEHLGMMAYSSQYLRHPNLIPYNSNDHGYLDVNGHPHHHHLSVSNNRINMQPDNVTYVKNSEVTYVKQPQMTYVKDPDVTYVKQSQIAYLKQPEMTYVKQPEMTYVKEPEVTYVKQPLPTRENVIYVRQPIGLTTVYNKNNNDDNNNVNNNNNVNLDDTASTITSLASNAAPTFHLVRKSSIHAPRIEAPPVDQLKVDIYSVGVIMESKMTGAFDPEKLKVEAVAPSGRVIKISGDGQYAAQFNADEIGRWKVSMYYDGRFMDGCPIDVCDPSQVKVKELQGGHVGKNNIFFVDCTRAGQGDLGVDISHQGRHVSTHVMQTSTPGYYKVSYMPYQSGPYAINVHFNRAEVREADFHTFDPEERQRKAVFYTRVEPREGYIEVKASCDWEIDYITGGPFICHVTDVTDIAVYGMDDGTVCAHPELIADCSRVGDGRIDAEVTHNGLRYPCKVRKDRPMVYRVSFRPRGPGTYKVWINYDSQPVKGSPFIQEIEELEKPSAHGDGLYRGVPGKPATFTIDPRGFPGQVSVAVNGPTKPVNSTLEPQPDNTIKATYYPTERGPHTVHVKLDGKDIESSPYRPLIVDPVNVRVSGGWRPYLDEKGVIPLRVNKEKHLPFDVSEAGPGELTSEVQGPNGKIPVAIDARNDGKHSVIFTPREEGKHYIHVNWGGYPLSNSPYLGYATHEPELDPNETNVRLVPIHLHPFQERAPTSPRSSLVDGPVGSGRGNEPDIIYKPVEAPYRPPEGIMYGPTEVIYKPQQHPHRVQVLPVYTDARDSPSPNTLSPRSSKSSHGPSPVPASPPHGPQKVVLSGKGLREAEVDKPANFYVDGTKANPGTPTSHLEGVRNNRVPVTSEPVRPQVYKCTYVPERPGAYLLYVNWNEKPLRGSPFKVDVREPAKPHKVTASGNPTNAIMGKDLEMKIDPRHAGPGQLTVKCTDPKGADIPTRLVDNFDGTRSLKITPRMPGRHIVDIRYNDVHIMGSPYAIDIKESQIKGEVKVWGPGVENGILPGFQSTFWVETTGAGSGDLRVRIMGPKGAFHVKMRKASQKDKIFQCFYDPVEPGIYTVNVQWSGVHVEGSPFTVLLAYNERELAQMQDELNDNGSTINGSTDIGSDLRVKTQRRRASKLSSRKSDDIKDILY